MLAQVVDVQVDDVRVDVRLRSPDRIEDLLARHHLARMAHEVAEQCELAGREVLALGAGRDADAQGVEDDVASHESLVAALGGTAGQGPDARQQLREREGLGEIVVGAGVEPGHAVVERAQGRQHQHRRLDAARPEQPQDLHAIEVREHAVEQDDLVLTVAGERQRGHARPTPRPSRIAPR